MTGRRAGLCVAMLVALVCTSAAQNVGANDKQFQAALQKEMVAGDLVGAIEEYRAIAERPGVDRGLAATALLRMAGCHEKLGEAQARETYQRIVTEFADQRTQVVEAQARLNALAPATPVVANQAALGPVALPAPQEVADLGGGGDYTISRDGRYGLVNSYSDGTNVGLFEYETRKLTWLTDYPYGAKAGGISLVMSPDSTRVAYSVSVADASEVHVATVSDAGDVVDRKLVFRLNSVPGGFGLWGWTPDDQLIVTVPREDDWWQVSRLDVATGELTHIKSFPPGTVRGGVISSPDGRFLALNRRASEGFEVVTLALDGTTMARITQRTDVDRGMAWSRDGRHFLFVYTQVGQRDLWAVRVEDGEPLDAPFLVQRNYPGNDLAWAGDRLSYTRGYEQLTFAVTTDLDTGELRRVISPQDGREGFPVWSSRGDLALTASGGRRLVIRHPDGRTRELPVPAELATVGSVRVVGFNVEGSMILTRGRPLQGDTPDQLRHMYLYDLETDAWSGVELPGARPGWRVAAGFAAIQGGPDDYTLYYPVRKLDEATGQDLGPFEIRRQDADGQITTVYESGESAILGEARPLWLSPDGAALRFVADWSYRELDLRRGTVRELMAFGDDVKIGSLGGPTTSPDGRIWAVKLEGGNTPTYRIVNLAAGTSREVLLPLHDAARALAGVTAASDVEAAGVVVSPAGDQVATRVLFQVPATRFLVEDPLEKYLRETGGR